MLSKNRRIIVAAGGIVAGAAALQYLKLLESRAPYHDSVLTGEKWLAELVKSRNKHRFYEQLGISKEAFYTLVLELEDNESVTDTKYITTEEQVAIFLYIVVSGLPNRKVSERFQRSGETISRIFHIVLEALISPSFYSKYVKQPTVDDPIPPEVESNGKFYPYFEDAIGAIDGVHTPVSPLEAERARCRNRKGYLSLNHLAACNFNMEFTYLLAGWEGSVGDGFLFAEANQNFGLLIPPDKYYLADAGFASARGMMVPFRGVRYHLREWAAGNEKPQTAKELYNLRHASLRNVVERIFGVMKRRFKIIREANSYDLRTNAQIMSALVALHNFIRKHDRDDLPEPWEDGEDENYDAEPVINASSAAATTAANVLRERVCDEMWQDYDAIIQARLQTRRNQAARRHQQRAALRQQDRNRRL